MIAGKGEKGGDKNLMPGVASDKSKM